MAIEVAQITGDTVELLFNPDEDALHIGENLSVVERHEDRGLIVQIIELQTVASPLTVTAFNPHDRHPPEAPSPGPATAPSRPRRRRKSRTPARAVACRHLAIAKVRKMAGPGWQAWDGWIPQRNVMVTRTADHEILRRCVPHSRHPLRLGKTLAGADFLIEAALLKRINVIAGAQGAETSQLTKLIVDELIDGGAPCLIFDTKGAYTPPSGDGEHAAAWSMRRSRVRHLVPGETLKLGVQHFGASAFIAMLTRFGLPTAAAMYFESHVARHLLRTQAQADPVQPAAFLGMDDLLRIAYSLESGGQPVVGGAILSCLEAIRQTQVIASVPAEDTAFRDAYTEVRHGGGLIVDLSRLANPARRGLVHALVNILRAMNELEIAPEWHQAPFIFFDDAQPLVGRRLLADIITPAPPLGFTSFFVTEMVSGLDDTLLRQADHLFIRQLASDEEARHLGGSGLVDPETLMTVARRLRRRHSLLIGDATGGYPIIFAGDASSAGEITDEQPALASASTTARVASDRTGREVLHAPPRLRVPIEGKPTLPLFPEDTPALAGHTEPPDPHRRSVVPPPSIPTIAQVTATWDHIVKRLSRRRRIFEAILSPARPLRLTGPNLVLGFPPQQRFQQELIESEEYRCLIEEELRKTFGVTLEVTTEVYSA